MPVRALKARMPPRVPVLPGTFMLTVNANGSSAEAAPRVTTVISMNYCADIIVILSDTTALAEHAMPMNVPMNLIFNSSRLHGKHPADTDTDAKFPEKNVTK